MNCVFSHIELVVVRFLRTVHILKGVIDLEHEIHIFLPFIASHVNYFTHVENSEMSKFKSNEHMAQSLWWNTLAKMQSISVTFAPDCFQNVDIL